MVVGSGLNQACARQPAASGPRHASPPTSSHWEERRARTALRAQPVTAQIWPSFQLERQPPPAGGLLIVNSIDFTRTLPTQTSLTVPTQPACGGPGACPRLQKRKSTRVPARDKRGRTTLSSPASQPGGPAAPTPCLSQPPDPRVQAGLARRVRSGPAGVSEVWVGRG